jgi:hypothetical protein
MTGAGMIGFPVRRHRGAGVAWTSFGEECLRTRFLAFAAVVGLALAAVLHPGKKPAPAGAPQHVQVASVAATMPPLPARPTIVISQRDRDAVYDYYGIKHASGACPPGLVKQPEGCLPGQPRGAWAIGTRLRDDEFSYPLPAVLLGQLTPPPNGYEYESLDGDVLIIGVDSRLVVGALAAPVDN